MRLIGATTDEKLLNPLPGGVRAVRPRGGLWSRGRTHPGASRRLSLRAAPPGRGFSKECIHQELARGHRLFACALFVVLTALPEVLLLHAQTPARIRLATLAPKGSSYHQIL